ncbi:hypothetical protein B9Z55_016618 [Caenorhabditis nigoni]|nr:hypothetical protein B9Z55_016618 [Caenorhabditis nigoni]
MTRQWVFFAAIILVANGLENNENDHCGKEEKSSTPPTTTTMKPTTTDCPCSVPPYVLPFTNDKYTKNWWSNLKDKTLLSYNSSYFVDATEMSSEVSENGCSVSVACIIYVSEFTTFVRATNILVMADDQIYNSTFEAGKDGRLFLDCNHDGQYTYNGVPFDLQVAGCMSIVLKKSL